MPTKPLTRQQILSIYKAVFLTFVSRELIEIIPIPNNNRDQKKLWQVWGIIAQIVPPPNELSSLLDAWKDQHKVKQPSSSGSSGTSSLVPKDPKTKFDDFSGSELTKILENIPEICGIVVRQLSNSRAINEQIRQLSVGNTDLAKQGSDKQIKLELFMKVFNELIGEFPSETKIKDQESLSIKEVDFAKCAIPGLFTNLVYNLGCFIKKYVHVPERNLSTTTTTSTSSSPSPTIITSSISAEVFPSSSFSSTHITRRLLAESETDWRGLLLDNGVGRDKLFNGLVNIFKIVTILENTQSYLDGPPVKNIPVDNIKDITRDQQHITGSLRDASMCIAQTEEKALTIFDLIWNRYVSGYLKNGLLVKSSCLTGFDITKPDINTTHGFLAALTKALFGMKDIKPCQFVQRITSYSINRGSSLKIPSLSSLSNPLENLREVVQMYSRENATSKENIEKINKIFQFCTIPFLPNISIIQELRAELISKVVLLLQMRGLLLTPKERNLEKIANDLLQLSDFLSISQHSEAKTLVYDFYRVIFGDVPRNMPIRQDFSCVNEVEHSLRQENLLRMKIQNNALTCCFALYTYSQKLSGLTSSFSTLTPGSCSSSSSASSICGSWSTQINDQITLLLNEIGNFSVNIPSLNDWQREINKLYELLEREFLTILMLPAYDTLPSQMLEETNNLIPQMLAILKTLHDNLCNLNTSLMYKPSNNPFDAYSETDKIYTSVQSLIKFGNQVIAGLSEKIGVWHKKASELTNLFIEQCNLQIVDISLTKTAIIANVAPSPTCASSALPGAVLSTPLSPYEKDISKIKSLLKMIVSYFQTQSGNRTQNSELFLPLRCLEERLLMLLGIAKSENNQNFELEKCAICLLHYFYSSLSDGHPLKKEAPKISNIARTINGSSAVTPMPSSLSSPVSSQSPSSSSNTSTSPASSFSSLAGSSPTISPTDTPRPDSRHKVVSPSALIEQQPPSITSSSTSSALSTTTLPITTTVVSLSDASSTLFSRSPSSAATAQTSTTTSSSSLQPSDLT